MKVQSFAAQYNMKSHGTGTKKEKKKVVNHQLPGLQPQSLLDKKKMSSSMKKLKKGKNFFH